MEFEFVSDHLTDPIQGYAIPPNDEAAHAMKKSKPSVNKSSPAFYTS